MGETEVIGLETWTTCQPSLPAAEPMIMSLHLHISWELTWDWNSMDK